MAQAAVGPRRFPHPRLGHDRPSPRWPKRPWGRDGATKARPGARAARATNGREAAAWIRRPGSGGAAPHATARRGAAPVWPLHRPWPRPLCRAPMIRSAARRTPSPSTVTPPGQPTGRGAHRRPATASHHRAGNPRAEPYARPGWRRS